MHNMLRMPGTWSQRAAAAPCQPKQPHKLAASSSGHELLTEHPAAIIPGLIPFIMLLQVDGLPGVDPMTSKQG